MLQMSFEWEIRAILLISRLKISRMSKNAFLAKSCGSEWVACVASVSVEQRAKKRGFRRFARAKNGARAKIRRRGWRQNAKITVLRSFALRKRLLRRLVNGLRTSQSDHRVPNNALKIKKINAFSNGVPGSGFYA